MFTMRFGMRATTSDPDSRADLYRAALDMAAWAEARGCLRAVVSEHHASDDGYLPSPVPMAAALAARTTTLPITGRLR
jgi:alkanesulfonate monooxygenase SsuD/methylene tetrahydromethanopterin reductase-like flavin-dependent oxidoreductase (luciferase family)